MGLSRIQQNRLVKRRYDKCGFRFRIHPCMEVCYGQRTLPGIFHDAAVFHISDMAALIRAPDLLIRCDLMHRKRQSGHCTVKPKHDQLIIDQLLTALGRNGPQKNETIKETRSGRILLRSHVGVSGQHLHIHRKSKALSRREQCVILRIIFCNICRIISADLRHFQIHRTIVYGNQRQRNDVP